MGFVLTEEQKQIKALVRQFCEREVDIKRMQELADRAATVKTVKELRAIQPLDLVEKLHEVGLRQLSVPRKYGGGAPESDGNLTRAIAAEEAGYSGGPVGWLLTNLWYHCNPIATNRDVTEEQREWFFSQFMENHTLQTGATVSEPSGMTDISLPYDEPGVAMKTLAYKDGDEWVINGDKMFTSGGGVADLIMVGTRTDKQGPISQSTSMFWVRKDTPGVTMEMNRMVAAGLSGNVQTHYDNVRVPESQMIGQVNKGSSVPESVFEIKWIHFVGFLGVMQRLYEQVRDYAKERIQGGQPIIRHPNIAAMLGEAAVNLEALRAFMYRTAWETDQRQKAGGPINLFWTEGCFYLFKETAWRFCRIASEVYGGIGGSVDMPLESFARSTLLLLPAGETANMNAIHACWEYNR